MTEATEFKALDTESKLALVAASALTAVCAGLADRGNILGADALVTAWREGDLERLAAMLNALADTYRQPDQPGPVQH